MYKNAGKSIKSIVKFLVGVQIVLYVIVGLVLMITLGAPGFLAGILVAGIGSLFAWVSGLVLYCFGEIADTLLRIEHKMGNAAEADCKRIEGESTLNEPKTWICYSCGETNDINRTNCSKCNTIKAWSDARHAEK